MNEPTRTVLLTGASGYVGGRLAPRLLDAGFRVRCFARAPRKLAHRPWAGHPHVDVIQGDAENPEDLVRALEGCEAAYYLIHSMLVAGADYSARDQLLARTFAEAAARAGVERIVYLGGLGETGEDLSEHLSSRREVEQLLASTGVPVTVLRAAMIIGSGSASFEILRYLVERLPWMVTPRWVSTPCQPIGIRDVLRYLVEVLEVPETTGRTIEIGGADVLDYRELMQVMAEERGLPPRRVLPVPILTPRLSSLWIQLVTPISSHVARPLAEGLRNEVVCHSDEALRLMPGPLQTVREAIRRALDRRTEQQVETTWSDAGPMPGDPDWAGGTVFEDTWSVEVAAAPEQVFRAVLRIGGGNGWYAASWLWQLRGWLDLLVGGPGLRRGRRDPETVGYGDALDFWRVIDVKEPRALALRAEMKLPGEAELAFRVERLDPEPDGVPRSRLVQTARFVPRGIFGLAYWYSILPLHGFVFRGMLAGIRNAAEAASGAERNGLGHAPVLRA